MDTAGSEVHIQRPAGPCLANPSPPLSTRCCPTPQMDTEGSEVHISDLPAPIKADKAAEFLFTVRDPASCGPNCFAVRWGSSGLCWQGTACCMRLLGRMGAARGAWLAERQRHEVCHCGMGCVAAPAAHGSAFRPPVCGSYDAFVDDAQPGDLLVGSAACR